LNDIALMCPFLKTFKGELNRVLARGEKTPNRTLHLNHEAKNDLMVWIGFLMDAKEWRPISPRPCMPPLSVISFSSDAAGFNEYTARDTRIGCGTVGVNARGEICFAAQIFWPESMKELEDLGSRTTTLELIGLLLPFLMVPHMLKGKNVVLKVDNTGCFFAWQNRTVAKEKKAAILTRALVLLSAYLECYIHVEHLPRVEAWDAILCDRLSRERTTSLSDRTLLSHYGNVRTPSVLEKWLSNPSENWSLATDMLDYVKKLC
jgi:hypothetical protein